MLARFLLLFLPLWTPILSAPSPLDVDDQAEPSFELQERNGWLERHISAPWPNGEIPYCFKLVPEMFPKNKDGKTKERFLRKLGPFKENVKAAAEMWHNPKSARRAKYRGEALGEYTSPITFKYLDRCPQDNPKKSALVIELAEVNEVITTMGYKEDGEHQMAVEVAFLNSGRRDQTGRLAHELGRAAGLPNQHQLWKEWFIVYCDKIKGYSRIKEQVGAIRANQACRYVEVAEEMGWEEAMQFGSYNVDSVRVRFTNKYDQHSIMLFASDIFALEGKDALIAKADPRFEGYSSNSWQVTTNVNWYYHGPQISDLAALFRMYDEEAGLFMFAGDNCKFIEDFGGQVLGNQPGDEPGDPPPVYGGDPPPPAEEPPPYDSDEEEEGGGEQEE